MDFFKEWINQNLYNLISTLIGGTSLFAYITERKKRKLEQRKETIDSIKSMQEAYDKFTEDSLKRYNEISEEVVRLKEELKKITFQLDIEGKRYKSLQEKYFKLLGDFNKDKNNNTIQDE